MEATQASNISLPFARLQMEATQASNISLPSELVTKIIARMPFPYIFKARMLSKTWLARFSPIKTQDDEELQKQVGAASFQKQVLEQTANWSICFPFNLNGWSNSWAYEVASHTWRILPSLSFMPEYVWNNRITATAGALLFLHDPQNEKLFIANIFMRSWKMLPPRPQVPKYRALHEHIVTNPSMRTYKLIILFESFSRLHVSEYYLETYNSNSNAWSTKKLPPTTRFGSKVVHLNGMLYGIRDLRDRWRNLVALDCEEGTVTELALFGPASDRRFTGQQLVVCNWTLLMVMTEIIDSSPSLKLMKIDLGSGRLHEIVGGPPLEFTNSMREVHQRPIGHGDCVYFGSVGSSSRAVTYNMPKNTWSYTDFSPNVNLPHSWNYIERPSVFERGLKALTYNMPENTRNYFDFIPNVNLPHSWNYFERPSVFEPGLNFFMPV